MMSNSKGMKLSQIDAIIELQKVLERNKQNSCAAGKHENHKEQKMILVNVNLGKIHVNLVMIHVVHAIYVLK